MEVEQAPPSNLAVPAGATAPPVLGFSVSLHLEDPSGTAFSDSTLPKTLNLADFDTADFSLDAGSFHGTTINEPTPIDYTLTSLTLQTTAVPDPASLTLLALGVAGLAGYRWRRRSA